ncbi:MAG: undecaprenyl-diphosphate phosphatase [Verrucomicrobia bacterium]|nr:undecaprenyl-diphosphate phosphatase [Verrucomicrobiota bacterium]
MSTGDALVLGVVEGITEYLPISSTGHLIIANKALGLTSESPLHGKDGEPLWYKKPSPKYPEGVPLTLKLAADTYVVVIQFGAIAAVALLYWKQVRTMLLGLVGRDAAGLRLLRNLLIAFIPAAGIGFLLSKWIDLLFSVKVVLAAQVTGAILMILAEVWRKKQSTTRADRDPADLTAPESLGIGLLQCFALWPGMSRSMTTIVGGYLVGLNPRRSAEFSFLLGLVTLTAATIYKSAKSGTAMLTVFGWPNILLGCVVAAITAALSVKFLVNYLSRHGLVAFAIYRLILAGVLGLLLARGFF